MTHGSTGSGPQLRQITPSAGVALSRLESEIGKVAGVRSVSVVGDDAPVEIHIVAEGDRSPKQLVRDVQSLAAAGFGMTIDHRIVSIVQLAEKELEVPVRSNRPVLDRVVFANKGAEGWVKVALVWPSGEMSEGAAAAGATRETRARGAALAVKQALDAEAARLGAAIDVEHVSIQQVGTGDAVTVRVGYAEKGTSISLVGSAIVHDDVATASVHALLQAVNRKLG